MGLNIEQQAFEALTHVPMPHWHKPFRLKTEEGSLYRNFGNTGSVLVEEAFLLYSLVRMTKPMLCVDAGTFVGISAIFIAEALRDNGYGQIWTVEHSIATAQVAAVVFKQARYPEIRLVVEKVEEWFPPHNIDFLFLDTETDDRIRQFNYLQKWFSDDCWIAIHDAGACQGINTLKELYPCLHFKTVRELAVFHVKKDQSEKVVEKAPERMA